MYQRLLKGGIICIFAFGLFLYSYIDKQIRVTGLRMQIPLLAKELKALKEENTRLRYEIEQFEDPCHLMELAHRSEYSHLKYPLFKEVLTLREGTLPTSPVKEEQEVAQGKPRLTLAIGAKQ